MAPPPLALSQGLHPEKLGVLYCSFFFLVFWFFCFFVVFFLLFRATPVAYGSSQAKGQIGASSATYTTATAMPEP